MCRGVRLRRSGSRRLGEEGGASIGRIGSEHSKRGVRACFRR